MVQPMQPISDNHKESPAEKAGRKLSKKQKLALLSRSPERQKTLEQLRAKQANQVRELIKRVQARIAPPPSLTVSEWADKYRMLSPESSAEPGAWSTARAEYQRGMLDAVSDPSVETVVFMTSSQVGKALALDTPLPTPTGWTTMGDVQVGDLLLDAEGRATTVTFATPVQHDRTCYRVDFAAGASIVADAEHMWELTDGSVVKTGALLGGFIATAAPIQGTPTVLPLDSYLLGVWLGDGHAASSRVYCHAEDAAHYETAAAVAGVKTTTAVEESCTVIRLDPQDSDLCRHGHDKRVTGSIGPNAACRACHRVHSKNAGRRKRGKPEEQLPPLVPSFRRALGECGLIGNKHIPEAYLRAPVSDRMALLRGLMDTDGHITKKGRAEFVTTLEVLALGVSELLHSLGFKHTVKEKRPHCTYKGKKVQGAKAWRVSFLAYANTPVVSLPRKAARLRDSSIGRPYELTRRKVTAVTPTATVPVRCIQVDNPRHLFLAGKSMIPTHNTEILNNIVAYFIDQDPASMLLMQPTLTMARVWSVDRLAPMLRDTPKLNGVIKEAKKRDSGNTVLAKSFAGGNLSLVGSNASASLAMRPVRMFLGDEIDRYPASAGDEGDPVSLAKKRTTTYWNRKIVLTSTPTIAGASRVETEFELSDKRYYHIPCPHCDHKQKLEWSQVSWPEGFPQQAAYACINCGSLINDVQRQAAIRHGEWIAEAEFSGRAGFHLSELYSPWSDLATIATNFLEAKGDPETLKTWVNTSLGQSWQDDTGETVDWEGLYKRREYYQAEVPDGVRVLVAGIDVQNDRLEYEVIGYGDAEESWGIEVGRLYGDPGLPILWEQLAKKLKGRTFKKALGTEHQIRMVCIDSGGSYTDEVYAWCKRHGRQWAIPVKGHSQAGQPVAKFPRKPDRVRGYLTMVGADTAKEVCYGRYRLDDPGPGYCHFPVSEDYDQIWFKQATTERRLKKYRHGVPYYVWDAGERRNEATDMRNYALAAVRILKQHFGLSLKPRKQDIVAVSEDSNDSVEAPAPEVIAAVAPKKPKRAKKPQRPASNWISGGSSW